MAYADSESDIFGGWRLTPEQQYREEITSLLAQIYNTIESYGKLSRKEKKMLKQDIEQFEFALMGYNKAVKLEDSEDTEDEENSGRRRRPRS